MVVIAILLTGGALIAAVVTVLGLLLLGAATVSFVAICIKAMVESESDKPKDPKQ